MIKATIITYDVWGNAKDGFEVNDKSKYGTYEIDASLLDTESGVLSFLNEVFFNKKVSAKQLDIDLADESITYVNIAKNGKPLLEIVVEENTVKGRCGGSPDRFRYPKEVKAVYDNGGKTLDRYTVYFNDSYIDHRGNKMYNGLGMSAHPFSPQGYGQHISGQLGSHNGKKIIIEQLPPECQGLVDAEIKAYRKGA